MKDFASLDVHARADFSNNQKGITVFRTSQMQVEVSVHEDSNLICQNSFSHLFS